MAEATEKIAVDDKRVGSSNDSISSVRLGNAEAYADGGNSKYYEPIPEYEGFHRYDPNEQWSEQEEKKLIRRVRKRWLNLNIM
jgi:hypothetical protein